MGRSKKKPKPPAPPKIIAPTEQGSVETLELRRAAAMREAEAMGRESTQLDASDAPSTAMGMTQPAGTIMASGSKKKKKKTDISDVIGGVGGSY